MRGLRPLVALGALALLAAAAPRTETYWVTISAEDGTRIGYGYSEQTSMPDDGLVVTDYQEMSVERPGGPARRIRDRTVITSDHANLRKIVERIDDGVDWTDLAATVEGDEAVITRTTRTGRRVARVKLPPRIFAYAMFAPGRCVPPSSLLGEQYELNELNALTMTVDHIDDGELSTWSSDEPGTRVMVRRRYQGERLRAVERIGYDGDCRLVWVVKPAFGMTIKIRPASRGEALDGMPAAN